MPGESPQSEATQRPTNAETRCELQVTGRGLQVAGYSASCLRVFRGDGLCGRGGLEDILFSERDEQGQWPCVLWKEKRARAGSRDDI